jgi:hypothetical protein
VGDPAAAAPPAATKRCRACGAEIAAAAYICPGCKEYQRPWRSELRFWAGIASLITLIASGLAFSFASMKLVKEYFYPSALLVAEMNSFGGLSFANMSGQNVWIKHVHVTSKNPTHDLVWDLAHILKPQELYTIDLVQLSNSQFRGLTREMFGFPQATYATRLTKDQLAAIKGNMNKAQQEFVTAYLLQDGPEHKQVKTFLGDLATAVECTAEVSYMYFGSDRVLTVPCIGVIKQRAPEKQPADTGTGTRR